MPRCFLGLVCFMFTTAAAAQDASQVFEALYGAKIKQVSATIDRADDVALAKEILAAAKATGSAGPLVALFYEGAHDLAIRHADGFSTAAEAMTLLAESDESKRDAARDKLADVLTRQSRAGKPEERDAAGEALITLLLTIGDEKSEAKQWPDALGAYRRAMALAASRKSPQAETVKAKLEDAMRSDRVEKQVARLRERLLENANDAAAAVELIKLYLSELDNATAALAYVEHAKDESLRKLVTLAQKPVDETPEADCLIAGDGYKALADGEEGAARFRLLRRASEYYTRYLGSAAAGDLNATRCTVLVQQIKAELDKAGVKQGSPAPAPKSDWIDLLKDLDPSKQAVDGAWERTKEGVRVPFVYNSRNRIVMPFSPQGSYQLTMTLVAGAQGARQAHLILPIGNTTGVINVAINGRTNVTLKNERIKLRDTAFTANKPLTVELNVKISGDRAEISGMIDGDRLKPWQGPLSDLTVHSYWAMRDPSWLGVGTWSSELTITSAKLRMLSGEAKPVTVK